MSKYTVNNSTIESILGWIHAGEIAIPEIQRPFVWNASKVRDLMDSLYRGFPVGYIITWRNPDTKLKDGTQAIGKKILIDGQQRITALTAALLGQEVVRADYKKKRIRIAFNPIEERFEVANPAIEKDSAWISDIASFFQPQFNLFEFVNNYCQQNEGVDSNQTGKVVNHLVNIRFSSLGMIELSHELDIETVTEIFIRINSQGVVLSQADFAMSKIAVNESYNGINIRKMIDYFCHLAKNPADYEAIRANDTTFSSTDYFQKIKWIKNHTESLYVPDYSDLLRVAFTFKFLRGKLANLVSLLSGRDFETREYKEEIAEDSFKILEEGELSDAFWSNILVSRLNTSVTSSPFFHLFLMAQIRSNDKAFLSKATEIKHLIEERGDLHHIFPKKYLQSNGFNNRNQYNQIANYVYTQQEINIVIKHKSPDIYMKEVEEQCNKKTVKYGEIQSIDELLENLESNCIPSDIFSMNASNYELFLEERRKLMTKKIRDFYLNL
ncbi:DUF262 domain-containing protein (plasmid) [Priestia megaterium]|uniref:DUF262 domain-containing protein n=1 Tax=Priestia megaterium TaxID=1404 RepID=UPI00196BAD3B|nr:DUF262 domain-containing protein [Priestia megaterium]QSF36391.1 DUF262 domain-containing protein [Priestia megaterium]